MLRALITQRLQFGSHGEVVDVLERNYLDYFSTMFGRITPLGNHPVSWETAPDYDVLIITGGDELPNRFWPHVPLADPDNRLAEERFRLQSRALEAAMQQHKRVIAICYGMQLVNAFLGGGITWDAHADGRNRTPGIDHAAVIVPDNPLDLSAGRVMVNHYHNQGVRSGQLHPDLETCALDADCDVVEGAVHKSALILCLQWHPERKTPNADLNRQLFQRFLAS